ncbi:helix-turn-helix domain-containing protein [Sphingomonas oligoaromativorans]|uniref:helix-turn-helix domain-containing protein n=1 Tax=Sphingomonas oligoaromativorans TaxID=575322 RepID=UPI00141FE57F|nr:AraC family transcriptional regulator [Sphingomonas oligoaromativorans]NIJ35112.1 AraC-like DNA-binding protein [Sphingomonas oligoaromativorans]
MISNTAILDLESRDEARDGYISSSPGAFFGSPLPIISNDRAQATEQKLATLKLVLTQAQQTVSSDPMGAKHFIDRALEFLSSMAGRTAADDSAYDSGGLASWQARRAKSMIEARLSGRLLVSDLASAVRLSPSHFARAFKRTMGCSPHHYLLRRRIECAKERMRTTGEPLAQIALAYGFSDQAHFTRCFKRHEGETPTAWYRRVTSGSVRSRALA